MKFKTFASAFALAATGVLLAGARRSPRPDPHRRLVDRLSLHHRRRRAVRQDLRHEDAGRRIDRHRRRHEAVLRRRRRRPSRRHQCLARHEEERVRGLPEERRQGHRRDQDRLRRPDRGAVQAGPAAQADARRSSSWRSPRKCPAPDGKLVANPYKTWTDIDPSLPNIKIEVLGPPPTSGTRDSLHELFMEKGAEQIAGAAALKKSDAKAFEKVWKSIREDGAYVEAGENDNVIVQKLEANQNAFGIFGYLVPRREQRQDARRRRSTASSRPTRTSPAASTRARVRCSSTSRSSMSASFPASTSSPPSTSPTRRSARTAISPRRAS